jgi:hypothetical protein
MRGKLEALGGKIYELVALQGNGIKAAGASFFIFASLMCLGFGLRIT